MVSLPKADSVRRILVRGQNWRLGDSLMTTPFLSAVRRTFPNAKVSLVVPPRVSRIFEGNPDVDEILLYDTLSTHRRLFARLGFAMELRRRNFEVAFLIQRAFEAALLALLARIPVRIGYASDHRSLLLTHALRETWRIRTSPLHQVEYHLELLRACYAGVDGVPPMRITAFDDDAAALGAKLEGQGIPRGNPYVVLCPGTSYGVAKRWPVERWRMLISRIQAAYPALPIVLTGTAEDVPLCEEIGEGMRVSTLAGKTTLGELVHLVEKARLLVTIDNGNSHLASALGTPLLVLFGSSNPTTTGPLGRPQDLIYHPIYCSPCCDAQCREKHHRCMGEIAVDEVFSKVGEKLGRAELHRSASIFPDTER